MLEWKKMEEKPTPTLTLEKWTNERTGNAVKTHATSLFFFVCLLIPLHQSAAYTKKKKTFSTQRSTKPSQMQTKTPTLSTFEKTDPTQNQGQVLPSKSQAISRLMPQKDIAFGLHIQFFIDLNNVTPSELSTVAATGNRRIFPIVGWN
jgi:hypothetical protein